MNAATKIIEAMRRQPLNWRIEQLQTVARQYSVSCRCDGGSHHVFSHVAIAGVVSVPAHRPIKPAYVRQLVALIDKVKELQV